MKIPQCLPLTARKFHFGLRQFKHPADAEWTANIAMILVAGLFFVLGNASATGTGAGIISNQANSDSSTIGPGTENGVRNWSRRSALNAILPVGSIIPIR